MRIFLNGGGDRSNNTLAYQRFNELLDNTKPLLYVPLAMERDKYQSCFDWITSEFKDSDISSIEMATSKENLCSKQLGDYCAIFIGGGNTFKLLYDLKKSGCFQKIQEFINKDGIVFGGSAGTIIFGENIDSCECSDENEILLTDIKGFDVLNGVSFLCHYTNEEDEITRIQTDYLLKLSIDRRIIALPEEDTIIIDGNNKEIIGSRPYYLFENGDVIKYDIVTQGSKLLTRKTNE